MNTGSGIRLNNRTFIGIVTGTAILVAMLMVYTGFWIHRYGSLSKDPGWTASREQGAWIVKTVDPQSSAAGRLFPGDQILSVDGNPSAARTGPGWILRDRPTQLTYAIRVRHGDATPEFRLGWPIHPERQQEFWLWVMLLVAFIFFATGLLIAYVRPEDSPGRRAVVSGFLSAIFFSAAAFSPRSGMLQGTGLVLCMLAFAVRPYHVLTSYRFTAGFPSGDFGSAAWRRFEYILFGSSVLAWLPSAYSGMIRAFGPERAAAIASAQHPFPMIAELIADPLVNLMLTVGALATALVSWRNYKHLPEGDQKRRLRWVMLGVMVGVSPIIVLFPFVTTTTNPTTRAVMIRLINAVAGVSPLCVAYAVIVHRVLGLRVVLRSGLRYMLARNSLRFVLIVPMAWALGAIALNPQRSFADLALSTSGKVNLLLMALSGLALKYRTDLLRRIDRRFFREAYQQDQVFIALAEAVNKAADVVEVSRMLSTQIQSALHPRSLFVASKESAGDFAVVFSSSVGAQRGIDHFGLAPTAFDQLEASIAINEDGAAGWPPTERSHLNTLGIQLIIPLRGPNEGLVGVILLGEKLSEEPYTRHDRKLLDTVATQTGIVWENLQLRERLKREQQVRREVVESLEGRSAGFVPECPSCGSCYDSEFTVCARDGRALTTSLPISRTIENKYRLTRRIGAGGMGSVYQAEDLRLDRTVAVKVMMGRLFGDGSALQRFSREARASAKLDHPNVVRIFDFGELQGGGAYLVLEYLKGVTLRAEIRARRALLPADAAPLLEGVIAGVAAAHARGVVHRDLKPENIFLVRQTAETSPVVKILDFGLAVVRDLEFSDRKRLTHAGTALGTLGYMSREQFSGEMVDERTDIYSLGVIAVEMLTGELGLRGPAFTQIAAVVTERLAGVSAQHSELAEALLRALKDNRDERYGTVVEFREALIPILSRCPAIPLAHAAPDVAANSKIETMTQAVDLET
jgi:serine/threonine-protein kinase